MHAVRPLLPKTFELVLDDGRRIALRFIGPSAQGWVCSTVSRDACYRLLPLGDGGTGAHRLCEDAPLERRQGFRDWLPDAVAPPAWVAHPRARYLAPLVCDGEGEIGGSDGGRWYFVRYDIVYDSSLTEILSGPDGRARLDALILVLYRIQDWWRDVRVGLLPMPADIVFDAGKQPFLLATPPWRMPDVASLFAAPERALFLAPEYLRGLRRGEDGKDLDRFALGAMALGAFRRHPSSSEAERLLPKIAAGAVWAGLESNLPHWLQGLPATTHAEAAVRQLLSPDPRTRAGVAPTALAETLKECRLRMDPVRAARDLCRASQAERAYKLLNDSVFENDSLDTLLFAAEVARTLERPLEAVDLLERAIKRDSFQLVSYREQLRTLVSPKFREHATRLFESRPGSAERIDETMTRDFEVLDRREHSLEWEENLADHLLWRGRPLEAVAFIFERLFKEGDFLWWKFGLRFRYVRGLFAGGQLRDAAGMPDGDLYRARARQELESIKGALLVAHREARLSPNARARLFDLTNELEQELSLAGLPGSETP